MSEAPSGGGSRLCWVFPGEFQSCPSFSFTLTCEPYPPFKKPVVSGFSLAWFSVVTRLTLLQGD